MTETMFLSTNQAAGYLGLSRRTLEKWRLTGEGPIFRRFGRRRLYHLDDLTTWATARKFRSTSAPGPETSNA